MNNTSITSTPLPKNKRTAKGSFGSMNNNDVFIIDLDTGEYLGLQGLPQILDYQPISKFSEWNGPGRNNPLIIFGSSADRLEFQISWFTDNPDRTDVISRCKWLESMTKANGYNGRPHYARFKWGELFDKSTWVITSATYTLSNFDKNYGYKPTHAIQNVVLQRVTPTNATHDQIVNYQW